MVEQKKGVAATRMLDVDDTHAKRPRRGTGPLDYLVPWVIELRLVGTPSVLQVQVREAMVIGRMDRDRLAYPDIDLEPFNAHLLGVSRQHTAISARNSRMTVRDLHSVNGTYLNGERLMPDRDYVLRHGDVLMLGRLQLQVIFVLTPSSYEKNNHPYADVDIPILGSGQRVLILEEDTHVAQTISTVLEQAGFTVMMTTNIDEALYITEENMPQAVVTELILGNRSGLDFVSLMRERGGDDMPIVVVSGAVGGYQMGQAIDAGVDVFLSKPVGVDELIRSFTKILPQMGQ